MPDLAHLTADDFDPLVGEPFHRSLGDGSSLDLVLTAVTRHVGGGPGREPFSLYFDGPQAPRLAPDVHPLDHDRLGTIEVLISQIQLPRPPGADESGVVYEVVFA